MILNVKEFVNAVTKMTTGWTGFITVIIGAICQYQLFKQAVDTIVSAIKENDNVAKWKKFGIFFAQLMIAIGKSD